MNSKLLNIVIFVAGAALGSVVTWKCIEKKYADRAQEEIDSVKEVYSRKDGKDESRDKSVDIAMNIDGEEVAKATVKEYPKYNDIYRNKEYQKEYKELLHKNNYANSSSKEENESEDKEMNGPYVIPPEEFSLEDDYDEISLTYYADGVLTDEDNDPIENIDDVVGLDSLNHFGEYEDDSVFVRNDRLKADYEILLDKRKYSDFLDDHPHWRV